MGWGRSIYGYNGTSIRTPEEIFQAELVMLMASVYEGLSMESAINMSEDTLRRKYAAKIAKDMPWLVQSRPNST